MTDTGFFDWSFSINFSGECLGQSDGAKQAANLGDGLGFSETSQTAKLYFDKFLIFPFCHSQPDNLVEGELWRHGARDLQGNVRWR